MLEELRLKAGNRLISDIKDSIVIDSITYCQLATNISPHGVGIEAADIEKQLHTE